MPSLAQLRSLLPYAVRLLPLLTGVSPAPSSQTRPALPSPELSSLNLQFGEMQTESRSLRVQLAEQSEQLARLATQVEQLTAATTRSAEEQARLTASFTSLAALLRGLFFAILFLLVTITVLCGLLLARVSHA